MMNTKQIDCAIELAQVENFSRAAENLFISQPTFSYQIRTLEEEAGFRIFERSGKGASLTPAGKPFIASLQRIRDELKLAVELGQNYSAGYRDEITITMMVRQAVSLLPQAIRRMRTLHPEVLITPRFQYGDSVEYFLNRKADVLFTQSEETPHMAGVQRYFLYTSRIYLICSPDDPLAEKKEISESDLYGRSLMIGGGSQQSLRRVQNQLIASGKLEYFNSPDHDTTLTNVASGRGICLAPGYLNDHSGQYRWIPYQTEEHFDCLLCIHEDDQRQSLRDFIQILQELYQNSAESAL